MTFLTPEQLAEAKAAQYLLEQRRKQAPVEMEKLRKPGKKELAKLIDLARKKRA